MSMARAAAGRGIVNENLRRRLILATVCLAALMIVLDSFQVGRQAARDLSSRVEALASAGLVIGARYRHCLLVGGGREPWPWGAVDIEFQPLSLARMVDEDGVRVWPPQEGPNPKSAESEK